MNKPQDRMRLTKWLIHAEIIIGMNLQFDLQYLRYFPEFRFTLKDQLLLDLSVFNYLHDETRPERSLKALGPILRTHTYKTTLKNQKFDNPDEPDLLFYNAQDTHNTLLAVKELTRRISRDFPNSPKLSDYCLKFYSDTIWTCIRMSEAGIPMDTETLQRVKETLNKDIVEAHNTSHQKYGLLLEGLGSGKSKEKFINLICEVLDGTIQCETSSQIKDIMTHSEELSSLCGLSSSSSSSTVVSHQSSIRNNPLLYVTPKKGIISFSEENRNLLSRTLPKDHPLQEPLRLSKQHAFSQKLISSYCFPLLHHRRNKPSDKGSVLIPIKGNGHEKNISLAYPTWYCVPSYAKDTGSASGGTLQGRITCKNPSAQTFPKQIKKTIRSRHTDGAILEFDLSQIELRVAALLSGDAALMGAYTKGVDLHKQRTTQIFGSDIVDHVDFNAYRQAGKMINFADLFRSGPSTMQSQLLAMTGQLHPLSFFKEVVSNRPYHRPGLYKWQNKVIHDVRQNGYYMLPFTGQSRYFLGGEKWDVNEIVNFPIQTTAGNTLLRIQHRLHNEYLPPLNSRCPKTVMFLNIYDALYIDTTFDQIEKVKKAVDDTIKEEAASGYWGHLQAHYGREVPLEYDVDVRYNIPF